MLTFITLARTLYKGWPENNFTVHIFVGRDSSVSIATRYLLDGLWIESQCGRDFPPPSRPVLGPPSLLYNEYRVFTGVKAAGACR